MIMTIKDLVPYQPALELKKLGFREPCFGYYDCERDFKFVPNKTKFLECEIAAPTFTAAFRFFREKFDWQFSVEATSDQHNRELGYNYWIWNHKTGEEYHTMPKNRPSGDWEYKTYEEADLAGLNKLIEIVKNK